MRKVFAALLTVMAVGVFDALTVHAQAFEFSQWTDYISCLGSRGICVQYRRSPTSNVWFRHGGTRIYEAPYPWGLARTCPEGSDSTDNIFIFDPDSETTGLGLIGCPVCGNTEANQYAIARTAATQVFDNFEEWEKALSPLQ